MREIKFRAWHEGIPGKIRNGCSSTPAQMLYDEKPGDCLVWKNQGQNISSVMQYTGLKDKNGKEICEGDICRWATEKIRLFVVWVEDSAGFALETPSGTLMGLPGVSGYLEVVGNIHENPELIKE